MVSILLIAFLVAGATAEIYNGHTSSCNEAIGACYNQHKQPPNDALVGQEMTYEEIKRLAKETPLSEQCRTERGFTDCIKQATMDPTCTSDSKDWYVRMDFHIKFRCEDHLEESEKYWRCLQDVHMEGESGNCYWQGLCSVERTSQCFDIAADSVAHTADCSAPGQLEGVKAYMHMFFQAYDDAGQLCPVNEESLKRMMHF